MPKAFFSLVTCAFFSLSVTYDIHAADKEINHFIEKDRFGIGGNAWFGLSTDFLGSIGDFPLSSARQFFTNSWIGTGQRITIERNAETLNYPMGGDLSLDLYFSLKKPDPSIMGDFGISAVVNLNIETGLLGAALTTNAIGNFLYFRDLYIEINDFLLPDLDLWIGDRRRAGIGLPMSRYRPSQDDLSIRGIGISIPLKEASSIIHFDFGYHWQTMSTRPIYKDEKIVGYENLGYTAIDSGGSPLTPDYYVWIDESLSQRLRPIVSSRLRWSTILSVLQFGIAGTFEFAPATPGGRKINEPGATYGKPSDPSKSNTDDDFPNDFGFKAGADLTFNATENVAIIAGAGFSKGISTSPSGVADRAFFSELENSEDLRGSEKRGLWNQQALSIGLGLSATHLDSFDLWIETAGKLGNFLSTNKDALALSANYRGEPDSSLIYAAARGEYTFLETDLYLGLEASYELELLSRQRYIALAEHYKTSFGTSLSLSDPAAGDLNASLGRVFTSFGYRLDGTRGINSNRAYLVFGVSFLDRTQQIMTDPGRGKGYNRPARFYLGIQSHLVF